MNTVRRIRVIVRGEVQGVGYRAFARRCAARLGLNGWVRNRPDGNVDLEVEGPPATVGDMLDLARQGPSFATVDGVDILEDVTSEAPEHRDFSIR